MLKYLHVLCDGGSKGRKTEASLPPKNNVRAGFPAHLVRAGSDLLPTTHVHAPHAPQINYFLSIIRSSGGQAIRSNHIRTLLSVCLHTSFE